MIQIKWKWFCGKEKRKFKQQKMQLEQSMLTSFRASSVHLWIAEMQCYTHMQWWKTVPLPGGMGSSYSYRWMWVSVLYCFGYTLKWIGAQGFRWQTGPHPAQHPNPSQLSVAAVTVSTPEADWTAGLWGALWHMAEDESALSSLRESNHRRNYLTRLDSGFYLTGVPFFCK